MQRTEEGWKRGRDSVRVRVVRRRNAGDWVDMPYFRCREGGANDRWVDLTVDRIRIMSVCA